MQVIRQGKESGICSRADAVQEKVSQQTGGAGLLARFMISLVLSLALKARRDFCVAPTKLQTFKF